MEAGFYSDSAVRKTLTAGDGEQPGSPGSCDSRLRLLFDAARHAFFWSSNRDAALNPVADNKLVYYQGSVHAAVQNIKIAGCKVDMETVIVDHFGGTVGNTGTGQQQDTGAYAILFTLTPEIAKDSKCSNPVRFSDH